MRRSHAGWMLASIALAVLAIVIVAPPQAESMCGYFRPVIVDVNQPKPEILQPSQIAFITWDPEKKTETVTVQPRFEGNALDFGMVIPTPGQPKLHEMPRDFFKALGVFTTPKRRAFPTSKLMPVLSMPMGGFGRGGMPEAKGGGKGLGGQDAVEDIRQSTVAVLEFGQVGNLDYKIITADRPDDLVTWLKDNKYNFSGDEATLDYYVRKKYFFTVMKIDTLQMKKSKDGTYTGDVTPTRFTFSSEKLVYPTRITQVSVKDKTEALFYVQAPFKVDLPGEMSYQYQWVSMLNQVQWSIGEQDLTEANRKWLKEIQQPAADLVKRGNDLGFSFQLGQALRPNKDGKTATTLNWAKKLTDADIQMLAGTLPYSETVPDPDDGFNAVDMRDPQKSPGIIRVIQRRLEQSRKDHPRGYLVRDAKPEDLKLLPVLKGHVQPGQYLTSFRHEFTRAELADDLELVPAKVGDVADASEHEEILRAMIRRGGRFGRGFDAPAFSGQLVPPGKQ